MSTRNTAVMILLASLLLGPGELYAQAEQTPERLIDETDTSVPDEEPLEEAAEAPASNVVDVNEENFRRSMELRDRELQRSPDLTTGSYSRATGLQALEGLPEESQKHLREQLREVIVENGPWTPEDAGTAYPYVPSEQAENSKTLAKREQQAWGEMVSEYHDREAAILANAGRTQAATATSPGPGSNPAGDSGEFEQGQEKGAESEGEQSESDSARAERAAALAKMLGSDDAASPGANSGQAPPAEAGTEQNALELLTSRNQVPAQAQQAGSAAANVQSASVEISQASAEAVNEDSESEQQDPALTFDSDDVIAIEDLDKIKADPKDADEDQLPNKP